jgi:hypothetical protein
MSTNGTGTYIKNPPRAQAALQSVSQKPIRRGNPRSAQLSAEEYNVEGQTAEQFRKRVKAKFPHLELTDDNVAQWRGMEALEIVQRVGFGVPTILDRESEQHYSSQRELDKKMKELARSTRNLNSLHTWHHTIFKNLCG